VSGAQHIADVDHAVTAARDAIREMRDRTADLEDAIDRVHRALDAYRARHEQDTHA
jgi:phage shock protein A